MYLATQEALGIEYQKMASSLFVQFCLPTFFQRRSNVRHKVEDQLQSRCFSVLKGASSRREIVLGCGGTSLASWLMINGLLTPKPAFAGEKESNVGDDKGEGVIGALKSLLDPNEKTRSGRVLPESYLNSVRELVKTLRESLQEDPKDAAKFRKTADAAKESIRGYINNWKGQKTVMNEESYVLLEKAIRSLANFYSKAGPSAPLPEEIKAEILGDLSTAEVFL